MSEPTIDKLLSEIESLKADNKAIKERAERFEESFNKSQNKLSEAFKKNSKLKDELNERGIPFDAKFIMAATTIEGDGE